MPGILEKKNDKTQERMQEDREQITRIVTNFILSSPPGEFYEVYNDVLNLCKDKDILKEITPIIVAQYDRNRLTPVNVQTAPVLITKYNHIEGSRYFDPRAQISFLYDHLQKKAFDIKLWENKDTSELERRALEEQLDAYVTRHYFSGTCNVFASETIDESVTMTVCIECHKFQPNNFWNGQWRSVWKFCRGKNKTDISGFLEVHVHYYENGNIQLVSSKAVNESLPGECGAKDLVRLVEESESEYQMAISDNYHIMTKTIFKTLRRMLPVTRTKVDWEKISSYKVFKDINISNKD